MPKFGRRAKRHAKESRMRTNRMVSSQARRSGPVKISYLPGFGPPPSTPSSLPSKIKFPIKATINGEPVIVWDDWIEYIEDENDPEYGGPTYEEEE